MSTPSRTIQRSTLLPHRGRAIVMIIPPHCDYITLRQKGCRLTVDVDLASVYDMAMRRKAIADKAERAAKRKGAKR